jgi:lipoyl(octanoyl) transferase
MSEINFLQLGREPYEPIWEMQKELVLKRQQGLVPDTVIMVEHDPVYTLGKNADENHLLQSRRDDVPTFTVERGGDVTFHGPGQIVGYPILDLHDHQLSINWYMRSLEEVLIRTLAEFRIDSERREGLTGVWVEDRKIASLGVRVSRWVTMHGFALNVNTDLSYFDGIIPCGIFECGVTSMERILGGELVLEVVQKKIEQMFVNVFDLKVSERAGF